MLTGYDVTMTSQETDERARSLIWQKHQNISIKKVAEAFYPILMKTYLHYINHSKM